MYVVKLPSNFFIYFFVKYNFFLNFNNNIEILNLIWIIVLLYIPKYLTKYKRTTVHVKNLLHHLHNIIIYIRYKYTFLCIF